MATTDYVWTFDLSEYTMTKDVKEDYMATVQTTRSFNVQDIAAAIAAERTEYRTETIVNICNLIDEKIRQVVCSGNTVVTGSAQFAPGVTGLFLGDQGTTDPATNHCVVNITPSALLRAETAKVTLKFSGNVKNMGGARISLVKDVKTGKVNGVLSPGGMIDVTGSKIKCLNADGTDIGFVTLLNAETDTVAIAINELGINDPSRLMFILPAGTPRGHYRLQIQTYFSTSKVMLKEPRVITYPIPLRVEESGEGPDDL